MFKFISLFIFLSSGLLAKDTFYIRPEAFVDVEEGKVVKGKVIGIENGKILSIEDQAPKGHWVIDLKNTYLLPSFTDCHSHIFFTQLLADKNFEDALVREANLPERIRMVRAKGFLKDYLLEGFTSLCDLGNSGDFLDAKLKKEIENDSFFPQLFISGPGIVEGKGQFEAKVPDVLVRKEYTVINDKTDIEKLLSQYQRHNVDILKIYADNSPGQGGVSSSLIQKILASKKINYFKKVTFHAIEKNSVERLLKLDVRNIEHASNTLWDHSLPELYVTLTDLPKEILKEFNYYQKAFYELQLKRAKRAYEKKIRLVFGPDFYFQGLDPAFNRAHYVKISLRAWSEAGIPNIEIIRALTLNPAMSLKRQNLQGVIKVGAEASLVGVAGNPLTSVSFLDAPMFILNKGIIVKDLTLNKLQKKQ